VGALQPRCVGLGLLYDFVTVNFFGVGSLAPRPTPNQEDQGLHFIWPLPFDLSGMVALPSVNAPSSVALRVIGARRPPLHVKVVVIEEMNNRIQNSNFASCFLAVKWATN
jgi:hypothetical protein